jgi:choline-sulfatase
MRRLLATMFVLALGCGGDEEAAISPADAPPGRPATAADRVVQTDLLELSHLADVDHHGLFIDFGGAARHKYTAGNWGTGWGADGADGDVTFTYTGDHARLFFPTRAAGAITLRFHLKAVGSRRMQVFLNGTSIEGVVLEGDDFRSYDVRVPAERVRAGENYLQLRFGGTQLVEGRQVSAAMASIRVLTGEDGGDAFVAPEELVAAVELGGVERQALAVRAPTVVSYHVQVPRGARFVFGLGAEGQARGVTARVRATAEGGETRELWHAAPSARWNDQAIDLAPFADKVVRIDLEVTGAQGTAAQGRVAWSAPAIMVPPPEVARRPREIRNVVVLLIDTLRADRLRAYNPESRVQTPVMDRVAQSGIVFEQAQSPENWTLPACTSVLTGLTPMTHGAKFDNSRISNNVELLSEVFDRAGFATGSYIANGHISDAFGFNQGWDDYHNYIRDGGSTEAEHLFQEAGNFIEAHRGERFFTYIQTIDPHVPYDPPAQYLRMYDPSNYTGQVQPRMTPELLERAKRNEITFNAADRRRLEALYDGEISQHDHFFGLFLERLEQLGVADETLIVITSDHGEEFMDHGSYGHGHSIFQELLGVPLIFHLPGRLPEGRRYAHTVSTMNIAQTVLDLTGVEGLPNAEGRSLVPDILGGVPQGPQVAFSDFQDIRRVARAGRYKLVMRANMSSVLFDLETDPREVQPEAETEVNDRPIAGRYMRILLGQFLGARNRGQWIQAEQEATTVDSANRVEMSDEVQQQLRNLGYGI